MGQYWDIKFGTYCLDSGPAGYHPEITFLLRKEDLHRTENEIIYKINRNDFVNRLEAVGYTKNKILDDIKKFKKRMNEKSEGISFYDDTFAIHFPDELFWREFNKINYNGIVDILKKNQNSDNEAFILELFQNGGNRFIIDPYFDPLIIYYIFAKEILNDEDEIIIDLSEMEDAELWEDFDFEADHFNHLLNQYDVNSLIQYDEYHSEEGIDIELKSGQQNIVNSISNNLMKYAIGYLNSNGGRIIWGINDKRIIQGIKIDADRRDKIKRDIYGILSSISPSVHLDNIKIDFINIIGNGKYIEDHYCLSVFIPKGEKEEMYFSESGKTWIKLDGILKELKGYNLYRYIKTHCITRDLE